MPTARKIGSRLGSKNLSEVNCWANELCCCYALTDRFGEIATCPWIRGLPLIDPRLKQFTRQMPESSIQLLLESNENVRDIFAIVDPDRVELLDFERLERIKTTFIPKDLRKLEADMLYTVPFRTAQGDAAREVLVYVLIEHQSDSDRLMMFRLLEYMMAIWKYQLNDWKSNKEADTEFRFRSILPIVFYTGTKSWSRIKPMTELVELGIEFPMYVPSCSPLFLNVRDASIERLKQGGRLGQVLRLVQSRNADFETLRRTLHDVLRELDSMSESQSHRWRDFLYYLFCLVYHYRGNEEQSVLQRSIEEAATKSRHQSETSVMGKTIAQALREEGIKEGKKEGKKEGELLRGRELLGIAISERFGQVPPEMQVQIDTNDNLEMLTEWMRQALRASTLDELAFSGQGQ